MVDLNSIYVTKCMKYGSIFSDRIIFALHNGRLWSINSSLVTGGGSTTPITLQYCNGSAIPL